MKRQHKIAAFVLVLILISASLFPVTATASSGEDGRYYDQLDKDSKKIYGALSELTPQTLKQCGRDLDGSYIYAVEATFPLWVKNVQNAFSLYSSAEFAEFYVGLATSLYKAIAAFDYDNPGLFWMDKQMQMKVSREKAAHPYYEFSVELYIDVQDSFENSLSSAQNKYDAALNGVSLTGNTRYEKLKSIYDYLCNTVRYVDSNTTEHSAYGALVDKAAVCEGYARAFKALCEREGIPCKLVSGQGVASTGIESHMWNAVQMEDGKWYGVDATWGDQNGSILYDYFLAGSSTPGRASQNRTFSQSHLAFNVVSTCTISSTWVNETINIKIEYPQLAQSAYTAPSEPSSGPGEITVVFAGRYVSIDNTTKVVRNVEQKQRVRELIDNYASLDLVVVNASGRELGPDDYAGTGTEVYIFDNGTKLGYYTVVVTGDVDGDAVVTAADARSVLRASTRLTNLSNAAYSAANVENTAAVQASSARKILRVSAKLDQFSYN